MKVLSDPGIAVRFPDFGIAIPVSPGKQERILAGLRSDPELARSESRWLVDGITESVTREDLLRVHSRRYVDALYSEGLEAETMRTLELIGPDGQFHRYDPAARKRPWTDLLERNLLVASGTYQSCRIALEGGSCYFLSGGMHHAQADHGAGFCPFNDIVIACRRLQAERRAGTFWVVDLDAHKGDGTAALTRDDPSIVTLSVHMARGWPLDRPFSSSDPSFIPSDIDIPVEEGEEDRYCEKLQAGLESMSKNFPRPDMVLVVDGSDPWEHDGLESAGLLRLTAGQMFERSRLVHEYFRDRVPSAWLASGGYGARSWEIPTRFLGHVLKEGIPRSDPGKSSDL